MARIALVCEPPDGGVAEHVARLAAGLGAHGHEPVVFDSRRLPFRRDYAHPHLDARALGRLDAGAAAASTSSTPTRPRRAWWGGSRRGCAACPRSTRRTASRSWARCREARRRFGLAVERALAPLTDAR